MKQKLVQEFDELTDRDMDEAGDDPDKIVSTIQQKTGQPREAVDSACARSRSARRATTRGRRRLSPVTLVQLRGSATLRTRSQIGRSSGSEMRLTRTTSRMTQTLPACVTSIAEPSPTSIPATTSLG